MKKILSLFSLAMLLSIAFAGVAGAGISGSRHDLTNAGAAAYSGNIGALASWGACGPCHVPHGATGDRLFPSFAGAGGGFFGPLCMSCHGVAAVNDINTVVDDTVFGARAHGLSKLNGAVAAVAGNDQDVEGSTFPYVVTDATNGADNIECLSCHDVHNQKNARPFLQENIDTLCDACHPNRTSTAADTGWLNDVGGIGSTHPAGAAFVSGNISGIGGGGGVNNNSPMLANFAFPLATNTGTESTWAAGGPWNSGPHLTGYGAYGTGGVSCTTCHTVHWDEDNGATAARDNAYLGFADDTAAAGLANAFCEACHQGAQTVPALGYDAASTETTWWNPGATTDSHPNDDVGSVSTTVPVNTAWRVSTTSFQDGTGISSLVCTSCHGIHRQMGDAVNSETMANTPILVNFAAAANTGDVCQACHDDGTFVAEHHPASNPSYATLGNDAGAGNLTCAGGNLLANTCHGGNSPGAAAHNRDSALGLMGGTNLRCVVCHSTNPSTYTTATPYAPSGLGTHYISVNAALAVSNANTDYSMPGVNRSTDPGDTSIRTAGSAGGAGVWIGSGLTSLFGDDDANGVPDNDVLVCESCHRLLPGNVTSDNGTRLMAEAVGSTYEIGDGGAGAAPYVYAAANRYLCAGCHTIPGGTHPLNNADTTRSANALGIPHKNVPVGPYWPAAPANTGFTTTTNSLMNCESCHAAHDANTESASFILDSSVDLGANADPLAIHPVIDYTQFCAVCHGGFN